MGGEEGRGARDSITFVGSYVLVGLLLLLKNLFNWFSLLWLGR